MASKKRKVKCDFASGSQCTHAGRGGGSRDGEPADAALPFLPELGTAVRDGFFARAAGRLTEERTHARVDRTSCFLGSRRYLCLVFK